MQPGYCADLDVDFRNHITSYSIFTSSHLVSLDSVWTYSAYNFIDSYSEWHLLVEMFDLTWVDIFFQMWKSLRNISCWAKYIILFSVFIKFLLFARQRNESYCYSDWKLFTFQHSILKYKQVSDFSLLTVDCQKEKESNKLAMWYTDILAAVQKWNWDYLVKIKTKKENDI